MKIAILSANLGEFDTTPKDPVKQDLPEGYEVTFHRFTDKDFPPIAGLTGRFQYRIPKLFGWQMFPGYDIYIWLDASMSLQRSDSVKYLLDNLRSLDAAFFRHPWRGTVKQEVQHLEEKLLQKNKYLLPRYENGLHKEIYNEILLDKTFRDENLYASNVFIYRNNERVQAMMKEWWYLQSRYFTCDQIALSWAIHKTQTAVMKIPDNLFKIGYISLVSKH